MEDSFVSGLLEDLESIRSTYHDNRATPPLESRAENHAKASKFRCKIVFSHIQRPFGDDGVDLTSQRRGVVDSNHVTKLATVTLDDDSWEFCVKIQLTADFPSEAPLVLVRRKAKAPIAMSPSPAARGKNAIGKSGKGTRSNRERRRSKLSSSAEHGAESSHAQSSRAQSSVPERNFPAEIVEFSSRLTAGIVEGNNAEAGQQKQRGFLKELFDFVASLQGSAVEDDEEEEEEEKCILKVKRREKFSLEKEEETNCKKWEKKPPMKTSADVINRLIWEEAVSLSRVRIGYLDRFVGIVEESFTLFDWGDLAEAEKSALAIPKHRIEYFKVDARIVWRKADRLDDVFGSTGSGNTIVDVLKELKVDREMQNEVVEEREETNEEVAEEMQNEEVAEELQDEEVAEEGEFGVIVDCHCVERDERFWCGNDRINVDHAESNFGTETASNHLMEKEEGAAVASVPVIKDDSREEDLIWADNQNRREEEPKEQRSKRPGRRE